jgi:hypothetical protein
MWENREWRERERQRGKELYKGFREEQRASERRDARNVLLAAILTALLARFIEKMRANPKKAIIAILIAFIGTLATSGCISDGYFFASFVVFILTIMIAGAVINYSDRPRMTIITLIVWSVALIGLFSHRLQTRKNEASNQRSGDRNSTFKDTPASQNSPITYAAKKLPAIATTQPTPCQTASAAANGQSNQAITPSSPCKPDPTQLSAASPSTIPTPNQNDIGANGNAGDLPPNNNETSQVPPLSSPLETETPASGQVQASPQITDQSANSTSPDQEPTGAVPVDAINAGRISGEAPQYPEIAKIAKIQGVVVLHAVISKRGMLRT